MDIAGLSMQMSANRIQSQVGTQILAKTMDTNEQLAEGIVSMIDASSMERSVNPAVGSNFDVRL